MPHQLTANQQALYHRLQQWSPDAPNATLTFSKRLARENGWSHGYAKRVVEEYKKFVFLAVCAGHPVTPSHAVDQAWHLHLTYTQSYWDDLCGDILQQKLHHHPTQGGKSEDNKFYNWYERTLQTYRHFFGSPPPADIWLPATQRFSSAIHQSEIDKNRVWIIRKPNVSPKAILRITAALFAGMVLWGCVRSGNAINAALGITISVGVLMTIGIIALIRNMRRTSRPRKHFGDAASTDAGNITHYSSHDSGENSFGAATATGFAGFAGGSFGGGGAGGSYESPTDDKTTADSVDSSSSDSSSTDSGSSDSGGGSDSSGCSSGCGGGGD